MWISTYSWRSRDLSGGGQRKGWKWALRLMRRHWVESCDSLVRTPKKHSHCVVGGLTWGQQSPTSCWHWLCGKTAKPVTCRVIVLSVAAFKPQRQSPVVAPETLWDAELKLFTLWPFAQDASGNPTSIRQQASKEKEWHIHCQLPASPTYCSLPASLCSSHLSSPHFLASAQPRSLLPPNLCLQRVCCGHSLQAPRPCRLSGSLPPLPESS